MPRKNKRSQAQKKRWKPLDLVDPAVPMLTGHNQDEAVSSFPSDQQTAPAGLSLETKDRPTSLCSPGTKQTAPASLSLETQNRPTSLCPPGSKSSETRPPAKRVWATDDFHMASNSPPKKPFHNTNEELLTEELQSNAVQHFWCVSATHCQSDERYTEFSRNHQCTCNALTFLAYLNEEHQFNTARLDKVLEQGDALYCWIKTHLQQERRYTQNHLTMEDLPKEVHADINVYSVKMDNIRYGYLKAEDKTYQRKDWWLPLASRLVCLSTDVSYALLMVSPQCIAVFRDKSGRYGLFDSHSRSAAGLPQPNGTAVMLTFTHVNDLITHLHNLFQNQGRYARYEFVPVSFKRLSTHNEQPAQSTQATPGATGTSPQNDEPQITNPTVQVPQPESAQTYMTMLESALNPQEDKMASNQICEHQLETSVDQTSNIQTEQQENLELNNERDKVIDKPPQKARNVCRLNKQRRGKAIRQAQKSHKQHVKAKEKSSSEDLAKKINKKRHEKERYACFPEFRMKKLQAVKTQYAQNCHRHKQKLLSAKDYYANPHIQEKIKARNVKRYKNDPHFQQKKRHYIIRRYATDASFRTRQKRYVFRRYNTDADFQNRQRQYLVQRPSNEAQLLQVQLKRHIRFKGYQHFYTVNMKNVLAGLSKLKEMHSEYKDVSIDDDATFADPTNNQIIETEHDTADADIQDALPRNFDNQIVPERRTTENTTAGILEPCHDVNELLEPEQSNGEPLQDTEKEKEELRPGLVLDTCMQPPDIAQEILSYGEGIFSIAPAQGNRPVGFFSIPKLEAMAFPVQFPTGQNTLDEARQVKLSPSMYFNTRLFSADTRFATDQSYLFFAQFVTETHMATNSMSIQLRKGKAITKDGRRICNRMLQNKDEVERLINNKDATRFMKPLRGTPAYWEKALKDLHAMVRQLGKPTFFLTFSAAEMRWPEVVEVIKTQQGEQVDFSQLDWNTKCEILRSNPVTVMRLFEKRVDALMTTLILSPAQPIGEVEDYFYRVEFQARGSPHIHLLVWVKDAPKFGSDLEDHVYKFIDKYITCKMPDQNADPELHKIVSEVQVHSRNHSRSCKKGNVSCRFGFPKLPVDHTMITFPSPDDDDDHNDKQHSTSKEKGTNEKQKQKNRRMALAKKQKEAKEKLQPLRDLLCDPNSSFEDLSELLHKCKLTYEQYLDCAFNLSNGHVILLKREPNDCWVNAYNADLLRAWNANMDIQYVIDDYSCLMYIMSYVSKPEFEMTQFLNGVIQEVKTSNVNERDEMKQIMQAYAKHREVSAQESVARTCSLPLKKCSRSVVFIQTDDDALKMSLPMSRLQSMAPDDENVWMSGLPEKYANRPRTPEFERMCLAEFASEYRILYSRQTESKNAIPLLNNMGYIQKRTRGKPAIIRYPRFSEKKQPEKFYSRLLKLYFPHRSNDDLKNTTYPTSEQFYKSGRKHGFAVRPIVTFNKKRYESHGKTMERALEQIEQQGPLINAWNTFAPEVEVDRLECVAQRQSRHDTDENEMDIVPDYQVSGSSSGAMPAIIAPKLSPDFVRKMYQSLNETQASIFYAVREWCFKLVWGHCPEQFFYFVSGGAGCGKSHVIKCIYEEATKILHQLPRFRDQADMSYPAVLLTAFTGTAAFNISGKTLHSLLKLPKSLKPPYQGLGNALDEVRASLSNAEILVIDEISMVSKDLFAYIHWRLQQIKGNKKPFGGMSILAVGDFYQLPPLGKAKPLCVYEDNVLDLWKDYFHMVNLTEIMRQKDDHSFAEVLNRIRVKQKTDSLEANDKALLTQAIHDIKDCPSNVLHIYATNKEVDKHNSATVTALHSDIINIQAEDYRKDPRTGEMVLLADMMKGNKRDLPDNIQAAPGVRVMIIRNLDVEDGLVNGTFGTITNIVTTTQDGPKTVNLIGLTLDNQNSGQKFRRKIQGSSDNLVYIEKCEESTSKKGVLRRQFPMKLAFACTAHKVQGMTMESAVVCLKRVFEPGMAYVALSRTTSLKGLYITDFDERKIYADPAITDALKNMRHASFENARPLLQFLKSVVPTVPTLTIIHHNAQGLPTHMEDMRCHHELSLADVLCITETHLSGSSVSPRFQLEQYNMATRNRHVSYTNHTDMAKVNGGGVAMYYKTVLTAESRKYLQNVTDLEFVVIKVESPVTALIATVYRPPNYSHVRFLPQMQCLLDSLEMMNCQPIIVCGDFNEDLMSRGKKPIQELFQSRGYAQLITAATTEKHTLIDHLYISQPYACLQSGVLNTYHSYHNPIYCVIH
ncbi:unnamed protein product [Oreochromis niloticus]|nr:unnamed protein product [Mustela putorius furo]